jgi:hypothetical protein
MRSIIKSAIRIIILFIFIRSLINFITNAVNIWNSRSYNTVQQDVWSNLGILFIAFLVGFLILWILWWKADAITRILAGNINDNKLVIDTSNIELFRVVLIFLGLFLLVSSIPDIVGLIAYHIRLQSSGNGIASSPQNQANELRLWIGPVVTILIGIGLAIGIKNRWWKAKSIHKDKKNMVYPSRPFGVTNVVLEGFSPEKAYPVFAINMDQQSVKNTEDEETDFLESSTSPQIAFFLVGNDNGKFTWIAENECKLAPF